jgi:hypothetical protein
MDKKNEIIIMLNSYNLRVMIQTPLIFTPNI